MARLVLVGLPGAGKSTLARAIAELWACAVIDTDDLVATNVGRPAAHYLREHGEAAFRVHELDALREALVVEAVVATGAGVVTTAAARELLKREPTWWLDSDDETLLVRVGEGERPLLGDDHRRSLLALRAQREEWYQQCARGRVDTSGSLEDAVRRLLNHVQRVSS